MKSSKVSEFNIDTWKLDLDIVKGILNELTDGVRIDINIKGGHFDTEKSRIYVYLTYRNKKGERLDDYASIDFSEYISFIRDKKINSLLK